ncbi:hypothetical protein GCM10027047_24090 [Rhodococcus aerolatus]
MVSRRGVLAGIGASAASVLAAACGGRAALPAPGPTPADVTRVAYGSGRDQLGELSLPAGQGRVPVVVVVHGGYWRAQYGLELGRPLAADLAARGVAAWNIEYGRVGAGGTGGWPTTLTDVAAAVDALAGPVAAAASGRLDLDDVRGVGHSAGGQLVVWAASRHRLPEGAPGSAPLVRLRRVVSQAGVLDLVAADRDGLGSGATAALLGGSAGQVPERYAVASPLALLPTGVPVTCVHGDADVTVPLGQSRTYTAAATAAGDPATLDVVPGADHFTLIDPTSDAWARARAALGVA